MKKSGLIILVLSFVLLLTALGVGAMSLGQTISVDPGAGVNSDNVPGLGAMPLRDESIHETVNMVFVATVDPVPGAKAAEGLVSLLEEQTGHSFNALWADSQVAAVEMMIAGDADFGWLPAMTYVTAHELGCVPVKLVAERFGQTFFRG